jgi:c-di-GMP-binding flagellar brake protein YcgR
MHDTRYSGDVPNLKFVERRRYKRAPVLRPVLYKHELYGETESMILDLSVGGAYIESPVVPEGSKIDVTFPLVNGHVVRARAVVRYLVLSRGMGVEFEQISEEDRLQVAEFVDGFHLPNTLRAG